MNKILRLTLLSLVTMIAGLGHAQTVFDFDNNYQAIFPTIPGTSSGSGATAKNDGDFTKATTSAAIDGITLTVSPATGSIPNRIWNKSPRLRLYSGTMTISSANATITKVVFTLSKAASTARWGANNAVSAGSLSPYVAGTSTEVTWTGAEKEIVLTVAANTQLSAMTIYTEGAAAPVSKPVISGNATFTTSTTVTITADEGATIYYTTDGSNPNQNANRYSEPFTINATTIIMAIAFDKNDKASAVSEATFTKVDAVTTTGDGTEANPYTVADICKLNAAGQLPASGVVTGTVYNVGKFNDKYGQVDYYINTPGAAATDTMMVYGGLFINGEKFTSNEQIKVGDVVTVSGNLKLYNKLLEFNYGSKILKLVRDGKEVTAIGGVKLEADAAAPTFNLAGQRVDAAYKGVVIRKGKKLIQR